MSRLGLSVSLLLCICRSKITAESRHVVIVCLFLRACKMNTSIRLRLISCYTVELCYRTMLQVLVSNSSSSFNYSPGGELGYSLRLQGVLSSAAEAASAQVLNPFSLSSLSTVLLQVSRGRPRFLLPSGTHVRAIRGYEWRTFLKLQKKKPNKHRLIAFLVCSRLCRLTR